MMTLDTECLWQLMPAYPGEQLATLVDLAALYRGLGVDHAETAAGASASGHADSHLHTARTHVGISAAMLTWSGELVRNAGANDGKGSDH
jgi:penicillin amidase